MAKLPPSALRSLMSLGTGVTKWLPGQRKAKEAK
jgi:hypothetical protein